MSKKLGHYSIIRFCPNLARGEFVNIGIALFLDGQPLVFRVTYSTYAIERCFPKVSTEQAREALDYARKRLQTAAAEEVFTFEDFAYFAATRANHLTISTPRPCAIDEDLSVEVLRLFNELVHVLIVCD
jgi:hypothetical protein